MSNIYSSLGVKTYINAYGTVTKYGGSLMSPEVLEAMTEAASYYVELDELQRKASQELANMLGVEAAYITSGAAAGIVLSVAACIAGCDPEYIRRIPNTEGMKNEIIVLKSHLNHYEQQIRQGGGKVVEIGQNKYTHLWELERAINEKTAGVMYFVESQNVGGSLPLTDIIRIAKSANIPVLVDAAAEIPPVENLTRFLELGADLVQFSGGKDIRGPQSSGFILGRKDLIDACFLNSNPYSAIGRPFKVDKETMVGLLTAVKLYLQQDFARELEQWHAQTDYVVRVLSELPGVNVTKGVGISPGIQPECVPRTYITWDYEMYDLSKEQLVEELKQGDPGIVVSTFPQEGIDINPHMLNLGEEKIVATRVLEVFNSHLRR